MAVTDQLAIPHVISPTKHAVLDYGVAATFFRLALHYGRRNKAAMTLALLNGGMVLGMSLFTDYPGGVWRKISFRTHRTLDLVQAALAGVGPLMFGFGGAGNAKPFYAQAGSEIGVVAATNYDARG